MKEAEVKIEMETIIDQGHGECEKVRLNTTGQLFKKGNSTFLRYGEEIAEAGKVTNLVKLNDGEVTIIRQGAVSMRQLFRPNTVTETVYHSPYGSMLMNTNTKKIDYFLNEKNGSITLTYILTLQNETVGEHHITWKFEEA